MSVLAVNLYLLVMAVVLAILEIQIEGEHGWAKNLPTWRPRSESWVVRAYRRVMSGKSLTGYHLAMFGFVGLIFHLPYVFGLAFTLEHWLRTLSLFFMFVVLWDFLWFVLNPHHPLARFVGEHNPIHKKWLGLLPVDYYGGVALSLIVLLPLMWGAGLAVLVWWLMHVTLFTLETLFIVWVTIKVWKIDSWVK